MRDDVVASCKTKIFTPNPEVERIAAFYEKCGMKPRQLAASDGTAMMDLA